MASITVETTPEERDTVLQVIKEIDGQVTPVSKIAEMAGLNQTRTRYVIMDLIEQSKIARVPHRAINKHYIRYSYKII